LFDVLFHACYNANHHNSGGFRHNVDKLSPETEGLKAPRTAAAWAARYPETRAFDKRLGELVSEGFFLRDADMFVNRTPGRLDLMGGNDDYTGGLVFETTIREATIAAVQARADRTIVLYNPAVRSLGWTDRVEFDLEDLVGQNGLRDLDSVRNWISADPARAWCAYVVGGLYLLIKNHPESVQQGLTLYLESDVPLGKGVSSSAALEVASMKAMGKRYGLEIGGVDLASLTQWVEIALTQSACGIMDQFAVVAGDEGYFVPMLCQPCQPLPLVKMPENLRLWGIDSGVRHAVSGIEYEAARAATFIGYRYLCDWENLQPWLDESGALARWVDPRWHGYLANLSPAEFRERYETRLPEIVNGADFRDAHTTHLDPYTPVRPGVAYPVRGAARYAVEENWRVRKFYTLVSESAAEIGEASARLLGELMYQAHVGYTECGLGCEATDKLVDLVRGETAAGLLGAKVTGGGAGGTVAVLGMETPAAENAFKRVTARYTTWSGHEPYVFEGSSAGSDRFGVPSVRY
jgi:galactokinase